MTLYDILNALLEVTGAMSPYLLLGFLIAGVLHVFVPKRFYAKYLSRDNKWSVLWAALLGVPLPRISRQPRQPGARLHPYRHEVYALHDGLRQETHQRSSFRRKQ